MKILILTLTALCFGLSLQQEMSAADKKTFLDNVNFMRKKLNTGDEVSSYAPVQPVPSPLLAPLVWDENLYAAAQTLADSCTFQHDDPSQRLPANVSRTGDYANGVGQTIFNNFKACAYSCTVNMIDNSIGLYNYQNNTCKPQGGYNCDNYLTLANANTTRIGCARKVCNAGSVFVVCNVVSAPDLTKRPYASQDASGLSTKEKKRYLENVNTYREKINIGEPISQAVPAQPIPKPQLEAVEWDDNLYLAAQALANRCTGEHDAQSERLPSNVSRTGDYAQVGQAIYSNFKPCPMSSIMGLMRSGLEKYTYSTNTCSYFGDTSSRLPCENYLVMASDQIKKVGCGRAECSDGYLTVCNVVPAPDLTKKPYDNDPNALVVIPGINTADREVFLKTVNEMRKKLNTGVAISEVNEVQPIPIPALLDVTWDTNLAATAQALANNCTFQHDDESQRLPSSVARTGDYYEVGQAVFNWWEPEVDKGIQNMMRSGLEIYDYDINACYENVNKTCEPYLLLANEKIKKIGCARKKNCFGSPYFHSYVCNVVPSPYMRVRPYKSQDSYRFNPTEKVDMLKYINNVRTKINLGQRFSSQGVIQPIPPTPLRNLTWDDNLAAGAQALANKCTFKHDLQKDRLPAGVSRTGDYQYVAQAIYSSESRLPSFIVWNMIGTHADAYNYTKNSCSRTTCENYIILANQKLTKVGCGRTECADDYYAVVCNAIIAPALFDRPY